MSTVQQPRVVADRYRLVRQLGQGGMGRVWLAHDDLLHRDVAIKEIVPPAGLTPAERDEMRDRTLREARAIARLSHPNVVRVFDVLSTDGDPWIVMEYIRGRSLQEVLSTDGPVPPVRAADIGLGVLSALRAAHRSGVLHRDVKPGNVLLGDDGRVVLTDFGLATVPGDPVVTRTGLVLGSPAYLAPERARDGSAGPEADLWSLGATLYAAVEGQSPYARPSAIATLAALATEPPAPARQAGPLRPVLNGLLRKNAADRIAPAEVERLLLRAAGPRSGTRPGRAIFPGVRLRRPPGAAALSAAAGSAAVRLPVHVPGSQTPPGSAPGSTPPGSAPPGSKQSTSSVHDVAETMPEREALPSPTAGTEPVAPEAVSEVSPPAVSTPAPRVISLPDSASESSTSDDLVDHPAPEAVDPDVQAGGPVLKQPAAAPAPVTPVHTPLVPVVPGPRVPLDPLGRVGQPEPVTEPSQEAVCPQETAAASRQQAATSQQGASARPAAAQQVASAQETASRRGTAPAGSHEATPADSAALADAAGPVGAARLGTAGLGQEAGPPRRAVPPQAVTQQEAAAVAAPAEQGSRRILWWSAAAVSVILVAVLIVAAVLATTRDRQADRDPNGGPVGAAPGGVTSGVPSAVASSTAPAGIPPAVGTTSPAAPATTATGGVALPAGWRFYRDPTGFGVAVPEGWVVSRRGTIVYFREPGGGRLLGIDQTDHPKPDPVADWRQQEARRVAAGDWNDYRRVKIEAVRYFVKAADWEFTYAGNSGRLHVVNRGFITSPRQAYAIYWSTSDAKWAENLENFRLIAASFQPER